MPRDVEVYPIVQLRPDLGRAAEPRPEASGGGDGDGRQPLVLVQTPPQVENPFLPPHLPPRVTIEPGALSDPTDARLVMLTEPDSAAARSYRLLRHRLLSSGDPRVVAVTSARPGEGKTTCAFNLALAMAEDTMTCVLLLEANLRRPSVEGILAHPPSESFVAKIARSTAVEPPHSVTSICDTRLHVAALPGTPLPGSRLDRTMLAATLDDIRNVFDYVVIDAASVLESGDVDVIGECSNGVIVVARAGRSRSADLGRAIAQLAPANVLGVVLMDAAETLA